MSTTMASVGVNVGDGGDTTGQQQHPPTPIILFPLAFFGKFSSLFHWSGHGLISHHVGVLHVVAGCRQCKR
jgi:hypothetical protein